MGFKCSQANSSLFVLHINHVTALLLLCVDDIVLTSSSARLLQQIIDHLSGEFALKDLGTLNHFLGIQVTTFDGGIFLSQGQYANDLLSQTSMLEASTIATSLAIKENPASRDTELVDAKEYRKIVGALQYLTITRIDICYAVNKVFAMPIVSAIQLKEKAHQDTAFFLEKIVYHGPPKSNQLYHDQLLKQSTVH
ncbi:hypothetical protein SLEP1_g37295 [Rubroshorea leprosula]|uniref:Reverse transcriptase Ty1/copia-type domain-containing protein n=1 Tax=Rubroshorea leprosula TaxID=152421 RepID=A0AAV5KUK1_9ROSI|nr:hypothetical protein SLEP1_g37295 [Rubroshorea leprosula]